jgi:hypothetical protein
VKGLAPQASASAYSATRTGVLEASLARIPANQHRAQMLISCAKLVPIATDYGYVH